MSPAAALWFAVASEQAELPESGVAPAQLVHAAAPVGLTQCVAALAGVGSERQIKSRKPVQPYLSSRFFGGIRISVMLQSGA